MTTIPALSIVALSGVQSGGGPGRPAAPPQLPFGLSQPPGVSLQPLRYRLFCFPPCWVPHPQAPPSHHTLVHLPFLKIIFGIFKQKVNLRRNNGLSEVTNKNEACGNQFQMGCAHFDSACKNSTRNSQVWATSLDREHLGDSSGIYA